MKGVHIVTRRNNANRHSSRGDVPARGSLLLPAIESARISISLRDHLNRTDKDVNEQTKECASVEH